VKKKLKAMFLKSLGTKIAALLVKGGMAEFKRSLDPSEVGGTALLGISKPVIKAHGSSDGYAFYNAIRQAVQVAQSGIIQDIADNVEYMRLATGKKEGQPEA
jgi:glycerol-3-phosphate acyltransferase PlsX